MTLPTSVRVSVDLDNEGHPAYWLEREVTCPTCHEPIPVSARIFVNSQDEATCPDCCDTLGPIEQV